MTRLVRRTVLLLCVTAVCAHAQAPRPGAPDAAATADSALEARTSSVASELRCPVCQGLSIQDSPSDLARSMRSVVHDRLAAGESPDQVKAYFVSKYGEWILLRPRARGFNLLAYALPVLIVLGGGALIAIAVRRWTAAPLDSATSEGQAK